MGAFGVRPGVAEQFDLQISQEETVKEVECVLLLEYIWITLSLDFISGYSGILLCLLCCHHWII